MKRSRKFAASLAVCFGAGAVGGLFTATSLNSWYPRLIRPEFAPPNWVFAPVWNILYLLMAVSLYFVWSSDGQKKLALLAFAFQLFLNMAWSAVFFRPSFAGWRLSCDPRPDCGDTVEYLSVRADFAPKCVAVDALSLLGWLCRLFELRLLDFEPVTLRFGLAPSVV